MELGKLCERCPKSRMEELERSERGSDREGNSLERPRDGERERVLFAKVGRVGRREAEGENQSGIKSNWHGKFSSRLSNARFLLLSLPPPFGDCYMFEELKATCSNSF